VPDHRELSRIIAALDKAPLCRAVVRPITSAGGLNLANEERPPPRRGAVIGLIVAVVLAIAAVYLMHALREEGQREDCLMQGRSNCVPIESSGQGR
jgi:hypothetical protein